MLLRPQRQTMEKPTTGSAEIQARQTAAEPALERTDTMGFFSRLRIVVAAAVLLGVAHAVVHQVAGPGDRLYAFIYERGFVQHLILGVTACIVVLLYFHRRQHRRDASRLSVLEGGAGDGPAVLATALQQVGRLHAEYGALAARSRLDRFVENQSKAVRKAYEIVNFLIGSLPALGLIGTMLGLSDTLYAAFSHGFGSDSVEQFVSGLATALDTTVLAMVCAAVLVAWSFLQARQESHLVDQYAQYVRQHFALSQMPDGDGTPFAVYVELAHLTKRIGQDAKAMFADVLATSVAALRETLSDASEKLVAEHRQSELEAIQSVGRKIVDQGEQAVQLVPKLLARHQAELAARMSQELAKNVAQPVQAAAERMCDQSDRLSEQCAQILSRTMADSLTSATRLLDERHTELAERMTDHMGRLETTLRNRTPEQVIIRYRQNGSHHKGA